MQALHKSGVGLLVSLAVCLVAAPVAGAELRFSGPTTYDDGSGGERGLTVANFNADVDSDPDVAVSGGIDGVAVLLGGPAGSFSAPTYLNAGLTTWQLAHGDFNGDTDPDLVVAQGGGVKVMLGGPGASFGAATAYPTGNNPTHVAVGDFNADGDPDLVTSGATDGNVTVLLGGPGGGFGLPASIAVGSEPRVVAVGDFNGDLDPDLAVFRQQAGNIAILLGGLGAGFTDAGNLPSVAGGVTAVGDFDGDTDADLAVASGDERGVAVLLGAGDGTFAQPSYFGPPAVADRVVTGDFDDDSDLDLAITAPSGAYVLLGGVGGTFAFATRFGPESPSYQWGLSAADVNADGDLDVLVETGSLEVALNARHGPPPPVLTDLQPASPANFNTPTLRGTAPAGSTVRIFGFEGCRGPLRGTTTAADFGDPGKTLTVPDNTVTPFQATAVNAAGVESTCSNVLTYVEDSTPPSVPSFYDQTPTPANDNAPVFHGESSANTTVKLYTTSDCTDAPVASGSASAFNSPGLTVPVADDSVTDVRATATDVAGNESACSNPHTYTEDSTGPAAPAITATDPASPADDEHPEVRGTLGAGDPQTVKVYANGTCAGAPAASGAATAFTGAGMTVDVPPNAPTEMSARAADALGNESACSGTFTYVEDSGAPVAALSVTPSPALTGGLVTFDASASAQPGGSITHFEWDLDGDGSFETDTGTDPTTSRSYLAVADLTPAVRVTSNIARVDTEAVALAIRKHPPVGPVGVSIDDGARYTNDPHVSLVPVWPAFTRDLTVAGDGGFAQASTFPVDVAIPWTLESSGSERLPKTVYVRFDGNAQTFTDDIILDESAPAVTSARVSARSGKRRFLLRIRAHDRVSRVERMQLATRRSRPAAARRFRSRLVVSSRAVPRFVRVRDVAGNFSRWRRVAVRARGEH